MTTQDHFIVEIARLSRPAGRGGQWPRYDDETHHFDSIPEALAWIKEQYGPAGERGMKSRVPCYVDTKSRGTIQNGWVYSGKSWQWEDGRRQHFFLQDWVSIARVTVEKREGRQGEAESVDVRHIKRPRPAALDRHLEKFDVPQT